MGIRYVLCFRRVGCTVYSHLAENGSITIVFEEEADIAAAAAAVAAKQIRTCC